MDEASVHFKGILMQLVCRYFKRLHQGICHECANSTASCRFTQVDMVHDGHVLYFLMRHIYELIGIVLCRNDLHGQVEFHRIIIQQFVDIDLRSIVQCLHKTYRKQGFP